jgi:Leucine-rich repeat (LRR) protein
MLKRCRRGELQLEEMPTVIVHHVAGFAANTLWAVLELKRVCWRFRRCMSMPGALAHLSLINLKPEEVDALGAMAKGVRGLSSTSLDRLPDMPSLRRLELAKCDAPSDLFKGLSVLKHLDILNLSFCKQVAELRVLPATLRVFTAFRCTKLQILPDEMPKLEAIHVAECKWLRVLPKLPSILRVNFSGFAVLNSSVRALKHLRTEYMSSEELVHLTQLETLRLSNCTFSHADFLEGLANLQFLTIAFWVHTGPHDLASLASVRGLRDVQLENNITDQDLGHLAHLPHLTSLSVLSHLVTDAGVCSLARNTALTLLSLNNEDCDGVTSAGLCALKHLRGLCLTDCDGVEDIGFLKVQHLAVYGCHGIYNLEAMEVADLEVENCNSITTLAPINSITQLKTLRVVGCENLSLEGLLDLEPRGSVTLCDHARTLLDPETVQRWQSATSELIFEAVE